MGFYMQRVGMLKGLFGWKMAKSIKNGMRSEAI